MIKKKFVVAGNMEEYRTFLHKHTDDINVIYLYVNSPRDLKGIKNIEGFYVGTYYKRHDIGEIKEVIRISKLYNAKVIHELTDGYITEPVKKLDNNHVIDYKYNSLGNKQTALNSVYGNVTEYVRTAKDYQQIEDNSMIDTMRD